MTSSTETRVSLLDLSEQLNFEIDDALKTELCFAETLIISCGHYESPEVESEGSEDEGESESSTWTCTPSTKSELSEEVKVEPFEIKDYEQAIEEEEESEDDDDFHFYFFPDCTKPSKPSHSKDSLLVGPDGLPKININAKKGIVCTCKKKKKGECECFVKLPCLCGAKEQAECTCGKLSNICICDETPKPVCECEKATVCACCNLPKPICTCGDVEKPCVCYPDKFPYPVCVCKRKPKFGFLKELESIPSFEGEFFGEDEGHEGREVEVKQKETDKVPVAKTKQPVVKTVVRKMKKFEQSSEGSEQESEEFLEEIIVEEDVEKSIKEEGSKRDDVQEEEKGEPCECQTPDPKKRCLCLKGKECICSKYECICGVQKTCVCEPEGSVDLPYKSGDSPSICSCNVERVCNCEKEGLECKCFPPKAVCTCKNPNKCKCMKVCDCLYPCICDTAQVKVEECICLDKAKQIEKGYICTCPPPDAASPTVIKKVRAGKHGYRWCHDVDPKNTFFDYAYDRFDKICPKKQEEEKFKILGLYDEIKKPDDVCPVHGLKLPRFKKKRIRKPSIDCCSAVGGISISVETLGEDRGKFLVHVVSNSSQEGAKTGSKLVSILDINLHTLEESRVEHITKQELTKERRSYMAICDNGYYNKVTYICGERSTIKRNYHPFNVAHDFLLEGANVVLLRYLGLRRFKGTIKTDTVLINGTICESVYFRAKTDSIKELKDFSDSSIVVVACAFTVWNFVHPFRGQNWVKRCIGLSSASWQNLFALFSLSSIFNLCLFKPQCPVVNVCPGVSQAIVNGKPLFVVKVERHIIEPSGYIYQTLTVLSLRGYMISHEWADNNYMFHLNPLLNVIPEKDEIEQHAPLREHWRDDLQLLSDYLDYKSTKSSDGARYVAENGVLTNTIRDFLQAALLLKPKDVVHFTRHYFDSALSALDLPHNEYFDPCPKHVRYYYFEE